ncbi:response regulator transcription factor [Alkalinema pantanalense CENA528]|uniref:response regulator transcription factor n=1 Tax=Alkalinema pantanalense TaxID=1620705 RepID=UPI003D6E7359
MRILIIEDNQDLATQFVDALSEQHYLIDTAQDGLIGWEMLQAVEYDLIILDVMLPRLDGITLCRKLREEGQLIPVLMLTARGTSHDQIIGLDSGADDYLVKPVRLAELNARVRALLRRGQQLPMSSVLEIGKLRLDPCACEVSYEGKPLAMRPKELALLELFLRHPQRLFSRGAIINQLWSFEHELPEENTVKSHIKGLRQKLKTVGMEDLIETVYGLGYRLNTAFATIAPQDSSLPLEPATPVAESEVIPEAISLLIVEEQRAIAEQIAQQVELQGWKPYITANPTEAKPVLDWLAPKAVVISTNFLNSGEETLPFVFHLLEHHKDLAIFIYNNQTILDRWQLMACTPMLPEGECLKALTQGLIAQS